MSSVNTPPPLSLCVGLRSLVRMASPFHAVSHGRLFFFPFASPLFFCDAATLMSKLFPRRCRGPPPKRTVDFSSFSPSGVLSFFYPQLLRQFSAWRPPLPPAQVQDVKACIELIDPSPFLYFISHPSAFLAHQRFEGSWPSISLLRFTCSLLRGVGNFPSHHHLLTGEKTGEPDRASTIWSATFFSSRSYFFFPPPQTA